MSEFNAENEATKLLTLADQAIVNQSCLPSEADQIAATLLRNEVLSLSQEELRQVAVLAQTRYDQAQDNLAHYSTSTSYDPFHEDPEYDSLSNMAHHLPTLRFVEADNTIYGVHFEELTRGTDAFVAIKTPADK